MIISIASTKGGVGKSTLAIHFAAALRSVLPEKRILLLDADHQTTCVRWHTWRAKQELEPYIEVQQVYSDAIKQTLAEQSKHYDIILIDVGGNDNPSLRRAVGYSNVVVIPTSLSVTDRSHLRDMLDIVEMMRELNEGMQVWGIFNNIRSTTSDKQYIDEYKIGLPDYLKWVNNMIMQRVWYSRAIGQGRTVFDLIDKEEDTKAKAEITKAIKEIIGENDNA